jgi:hypothetical protein
MIPVTTSTTPLMIALQTSTLRMMGLLETGEAATVVS